MCSGLAMAGFDKIFSGPVDVVKRSKESWITSNNLCAKVSSRGNAWPKHRRQSYQVPAFFHKRWVQLGECLVRIEGFLNNLPSRGLEI